MADQIKRKPDQWLSRGAKMIKRNSAHLLYLVDQIMDLAKLENGGLKLNLIRANVIDHLHQVIEPCHELAERKKIELEFIPLFDKQHMDLDPDKLHKIFFNLLSNAIKFNTAGGKVQLIVDRGPWPLQTDPPTDLSVNLFLLITIKDTGIGIPKDQLPFIFDRFYQVDGSSTREAEGTGLGLALAKEMLQIMAGSISVSSQEGQGSVFRIILPIRQNAGRKPVAR